MKRKTGNFLDSAKNSLILAIEIFNRPSDAGRQEAVLLLLQHSFEMLLKAILFEKTGRLRGKREKFNYGFEKCLNIAQGQLDVIDSDQALILRNIDGFRDAAAHDLVIISEGLLYGHAQSAVQIFASVLKKVFKQELATALPQRVLPLSTQVLTDITMIIEEDMNGIASIVGRGQRREDEAEARLRPYQVIEQNVRKTHGLPDKMPSDKRIVQDTKAGNWKTVFPMVSGLVQPSTGGIPVNIHATKHDGMPFRIDPSAPDAIAFRYMKPEDKYPYLTSELHVKLGISQNKLVALVKIFQLKDDPEYHTSIKTGKSGYVQRYSEKTRQVLANAIQKEGIDVLWEKAKAGEVLNPEDYRFPDR